MTFSMTLGIKCRNRRNYVFNSSSLVKHVSLTSKTTVLSLSFCQYKNNPCCSNSETSVSSCISCYWNGFSQNLSRYWKMEIMWQQQEHDQTISFFPHKADCKLILKCIRTNNAVCAELKNLSQKLFKVPFSICVVYCKGWATQNWISCLYLPQP